MTLVTVNPKRKTRRSSSVFDHLFNELMTPKSCVKVESHLTTQRPAVNVKENNTSFIIELAAPGLNKKDIGIDIDKDLLTIQANKEVPKKEDEKILREAFNFNTFKRTFRLPKTIDTNDISATFKNGILSLKLAKKEEAKEKAPRAIDIH